MGVENSLFSRIILLQEILLLTLCERIIHTATALTGDQTVETQEIVHADPIWAKFKKFRNR